MGGRLQRLHGAVIVMDFCDITVSVGAQHRPESRILLALVLDGESAGGEERKIS